MVSHFLQKISCLGLSGLQSPAPLAQAGWHKASGHKCSRIKQVILDKETPGVWSLMKILSLSPQTRDGKSTSGRPVQGQCAGFVVITVINVFCLSNVC